MVSPIPRRIRRTPTAVVVEWSDSHLSEYPFGYLRRNCPCAGCRQSPPRVVEADDPLRLLEDVPIGLEGISLVGHYAVQFDWNDGHRHGIYSFHYLRSLCRCAECRG